MKYYIGFRGETRKEWVLSTQLKPRFAPLPKKSEEIPEMGVQAWLKVRGQQKTVTIHKMESEFYILEQEVQAFVHEVI